MHRFQNYMQIKPGNREEESDPDSEERDLKDHSPSAILRQAP